MRLRNLVLIVATKDNTGASQQCDRDQRADHNRSSPARALHACDKRSCRAKTAKYQCDGGDSDISSVHETTSSTRKTIFLMN